MPLESDPTQPSRVDRRRFVQSGLAAGSLLLSAQTTSGQDDAAGQGDSSADPGSSSEAAEAEQDLAPVVVGIMGLSRGRALAEQFARQSQVQVKYLCDVDRERSAAAARRLVELGYPDAQPILDFRQMLDDPQVDALVCAAPNHWHAPATLWATAAGKHTYVEKPCSHNPLEGEWMVAAARQHGAVVQMGAQRRSSQGTMRAMQRLREGAIGRVYLARGWYSSRRGTIGRGTPSTPPERLDYELWQGPAPRLPYQNNLVHYNWHWRWHWGNGELGNNGVHALDLCRWGLEVDYPSLVTSSGGRYVFDDDQQTPDTHTVCFEFPGQKSIVWECLSCNPYDSSWVVFYGDQGTLDLKGDGRFTIYDLRSQPQEEWMDGDGGERRHIANFLTAVRAGDSSLLNCEIEEAHKSTLLCHLGNISQRVRQQLNCDPTNGHILGNPAASELWRREYAAGWEPPHVT